MARLRQRLVTKQPVKAIWTAGAVINTTALLLFWLIYFIPSYLRQHPKWTYKQAILNKLLRTIMYHSSKVESAQRYSSTRIMAFSKSTRRPTCGSTRACCKIQGFNQQRRGVAGSRLPTMLELRCRLSFCIFMEGQGE